MNSKYIHALNCHYKIGSQTIKKIGIKFDNKFDSIWNIEYGMLKRELGEKIADLIIEAREQVDIDEEILKLDKHNVGYTTIFDKSYPKLLKEIPDAPAILYIKGNIETLKLPSLAIVGSRKFTNYGARVTRKITKELSRAGLCIVSGLALGIDGIAHKAVVEENGKTVAVLACGLDMVYPAAHMGIARDIIDRGGAIISEHPPAILALKHHFPARNRIIAGLSLGTLVTEAAEKSGALITAYTALDYNREVFAVPGNIDSEASKGTNEIIKKGARVVTEAEDILKELNIESKQAVERAKEILPENKEEAKILKIFGEKEMLVDNVIAESGMNVVLLSSLLTTLEMKGMLENVGGGRYRRKL